MIEYRPAQPDEVEAAWQLAATLNAFPCCSPKGPIGGMLRHPRAEWAVGLIGGEIVSSLATIRTDAGRDLLCGVIVSEHDTDESLHRLGVACATCFSWPAGEATIGATLADPPKRTTDHLALIYGPTATFQRFESGSVRFSATVIDGQPQGVV